MASTTLAMLCGRPVPLHRSSHYSDMIPVKKDSSSSSMSITVSGEKSKAGEIDRLRGWKVKVKLGLIYEAYSMEPSAEREQTCAFTIPQRERTGA